MSAPTTAPADDPDGEAVALPRATLAEHVREQIKRDAEIHTVTPRGVDIDEYEHIDRATVDAAEWAHGDLHVWYESETTLTRRVRRATRHEPAEYAHDDARVVIGVTWDMDPEHVPQVDIEVLPE